MGAGVDPFDDAIELVVQRNFSVQHSCEAYLAERSAKGDMDPSLRTQDNLSTSDREDGFHGHGDMERSSETV